ncbi:hypothetical protein HPT25_23165 [Bacillus sp. BRMEA1]|uniref:hypothetical protein n=1 Tax=Neobacillus endophyticus TaxID=2738405 RepID=UPI001563A67C|nr:hypothetical protein [Neobacillus endophyticus]NRD80235.1 hypothetical protein [Neobacillus endophyticus]
MHIVAGYESNKFLEMAIKEIEESGVSEEQIVIIEMKNNHETTQMFDTKSYSDGSSILDGMAAWSVIGALFGIIYGSRFIIGPLATGFIGFVIGAIIGFAFEKVMGRKKKRKKTLNTIEFIVIINCRNEEELKTSNVIFRNYHAISIGYH